MTTAAQASPIETRTRLGRRGIVALVAALLMAAGVAVLVVALIGQTGGAPGEPREVSVSELREVSARSNRPIYWAGDLPGRRLELTETSEGNVFVRYLTGDAVVGDGRPAFTTVGTYPYRGAFAEVRKRAEARGMGGRGAPAGGIAAWSVERPSSVYLAFPGSDVLVEVYDPDPRRARQLALSSQVGPVR